MVYISDYWKKVFRLTVFVLLACIFMATAKNESSVSIVFVIDTTSSMGDELRQIKEHVMSLLRHIESVEYGSTSFNYILIPFNNPRLGYPSKTTSKKELMTLLNDITPSGGRDCPNPSLMALKMGLERGGNMSYVFLFTAADSRERVIKPELLDLIETKKPALHLIITGHCGTKLDPIYEELASISDGQLFNVSKKEVGTILSKIESNLKPAVRANKDMSQLSTKELLRNMAPGSKLEKPEKVPLTKLENPEKAPPSKLEKPEKAPPSKPEKPEQAPPSKLENPEHAQPSKPEKTEQALPSKLENPEKTPPSKLENPEKASPPNLENPEKAPPSKLEKPEKAPPSKPEKPEQAPPSKLEKPEKVPLPKLENPEKTSPSKLENPEKASPPNLENPEKAPPSKLEKPEKAPPSKLENPEHAQPSKPEKPEQAPPSKLEKPEKAPSSKLEKPKQPEKAPPLKFVKPEKALPPKPEKPEQAPPSKLENPEHAQPLKLEKPEQPLPLMPEKPEKASLPKLEKPEKASLPKLEMPEKAEKAPPLKFEKPEKPLPLMPEKPEKASPPKLEKSEKVPPSKLEKPEKAPPSKLEKPEKAPPSKQEKAAPSKLEKTETAPPSKLEKSEKAPTSKPEKVTPSKLDKPEKATPSKLEKPEKAPPSKLEKPEKAPPSKQEKAAPSKLEKTEKASPSKLEKSEKAPTSKPEKVTPSKLENPEKASPSKLEKPEKAPPSKLEKPEKAPPSKQEKAAPSKLEKTEKAPPSKLVKSEKAPTSKPEKVTPSKLEKPEKATPSKLEKPKKASLSKLENPEKAPPSTLGHIEDDSQLSAKQLFPTIIFTQRPSIAFENDDILFNCSLSPYTHIESPSLINLTIYFNGRQQKLREKHISNTQNGSIQYRINSGDHNANGDYECVSSSDSIESDAVKIVLTVKSKDHVRSKVETLPVIKGNKLSVSCPLDFSHNQNAVLGWQKDYDVIEDPDMKVLTIDPTEINSLHSLKCYRIDKNLTTKEEVTYKIIVGERPLITASATHDEFTNNIILSCDVVVQNLSEIKILDGSGIDLNDINSDLHMEQIRLRKDHHIFKLFLTPKAYLTYKLPFSCLVHSPFGSKKAEISGKTSIISSEIPQKTAGIVKICSNWSPFTPCSVTCGTGYRTRTRLCHQQHSKCNDTDFEVQICNNSCYKPEPPIIIIEVLKRIENIPFKEKEYNKNETRKCLKGFTLDIFKARCVDVNECNIRTTCPKGLRCVNTKGSYKCVTCRKGFMGIYGRCLDINECSLKTHKCSQICVNFYGSYRCDCKNGFQLQFDGFGCEYLGFH